jgi:acetyl esterase/lipase
MRWPLLDTSRPTHFRVPGGHVGLGNPILGLGCSDGVFGAVGLAMPRLFLLTVACVVLAGLSAAAGLRADTRHVIPVWPGAVPGEAAVPRGYYGPLGPERVRAPENSPTRDAKWITDVTRPTLTVYRPSRKKNTRVAMIVCPGGGYWNLAWDLEGEEVAGWLADSGITGIVLKYRCPRREGQPEALPAPGPLLDAQRAVSLVRSRAKEWNIDPKRIGIGGFSAGGHLALATATNFDTRGYPPVDDMDRMNCRPDFAVAVYPGYLSEKDGKSLTPWMRIPKGTPPVMLVHAGDDTVAGPEHSLVMFEALQNAGVPSELHLYSTSGHGFGVRRSKGPASGWTEHFLAWLRTIGMASKKP